MKRLIVGLLAVGVVVFGVSFGVGWAREKDGGAESGVLTVAQTVIVGCHGSCGTGERRGDAAPEKVSACAEDMVEIEGWYCSVVEEICLYDVDTKGNKLPGAHKEFGRCGEFKYPTKCLSKTKEYKHYCIDRYEWPNRKGEVPQDWMSFDDGVKAAAAVGKRACTSSEWELAAGGEQMDPIPYGDGYHRAVGQSVCNMDHSAKGIDVFKATSPNTPAAKALRALLVPSGSMPECHSKLGVFDLSGNVDEYVINETGVGYWTGLKGGHVFGVRNAVRPMTVAHNGSNHTRDGRKSSAGVFSWYECSFRACKDVTLLNY